MNWLKKKFSNTGTIMATVGGVILVAQQVGFDFDESYYNNIAKSICALMIITGVFESRSKTPVFNDKEK